jgi:hypothetical protein
MPGLHPCSRWPSAEVWERAGFFLGLAGERFGRQAPGSHELPIGFAGAECANGWFVEYGLVEHMTRETDIPHGPIQLGYALGGFLPQVGQYRRGRVYCQQSSYWHLWLSGLFLFAAIVPAFLPLNGEVIVSQSTGRVARVPIGSQDMTKCNWLPGLSGYILTWGRTNRAGRLGGSLTRGQTYDVQVQFDGGIWVMTTPAMISSMPAVPGFLPSSRSRRRLLHRRGWPG